MWVFKVLLVAATVIWGLSFVVMKDAVDVFPPAYLIGVRFTACGILLTAIFFRRMRATFSKDYLWRGAVIGVLIFLAFWTQTIGLDHTTPGKNAFLTATYCVIVPFAWWVLARKRPSIYNVLAAIMCVVGIGFVSITGAGSGAEAMASAGSAAATAAGAAGGMGGLSIEFGDLMTLLCAFLFAIHIVYVAKYSEGRDVIVLTVYQFIFGGLCGLVVGACCETLPPTSAITPDFLFNMVYLVVFASCIALLIQNVALKYVPPAQASLFLSLESVFGVLFSVLLYGELVTPKLAAGFVLIFAAIVVSETFPWKGKKHGGDQGKQQE